MLKYILPLKMFWQQNGLVDPMEAPLPIGLSWVTKMKTDINIKKEYEIITKWNLAPDYVQTFQDQSKEWTFLDSFQFEIYVSKGHFQDLFLLCNFLILLF